MADLPLGAVALATGGFHHTITQPTDLAIVTITVCHATSHISGALPTFAHMSRGTPSRFTCVPVHAGPLLTKLIGSTLVTVQIEAAACGQVTFLILVTVANAAAHDFGETDDLL